MSNAKCTQHDMGRRVSAVRRPYAMRHADELGYRAQCGHLGAAR